MADFLLKLPEHLICEICGYLTPVDMARLAKAERRLNAFVFESGRYDWTRAGRVDIAFDAPPEVTFQFLARVCQKVSDVYLGLTSYRGVKKDGQKQLMEVSRSDTHRLIRKLPVFTAATRVTWDHSENMSKSDVERVLFLFPAVKTVMVVVKVCRWLPSTKSPDILALWPRLEKFELVGYDCQIGMRNSAPSNRAMGIGEVLSRVHSLEELLAMSTVFKGQSEAISVIRQLNSLDLLVFFLKRKDLAVVDWMHESEPPDVITAFANHIFPRWSVQGSEDTLQYLKHLHLNLSPALNLTQGSLAAFTTSTDFRLRELQLTIATMPPARFGTQQIFELVQSNPDLEVVGLEFQPDRLGHTRVKARGLRYLMGLPRLRALCVRSGRPDLGSNHPRLINGDFLNSYQVQEENPRGGQGAMFGFFGHQFNLTQEDIDAFFDRVGCEYILTGQDMEDIPNHLKYSRVKPGLSFESLKYPCCFVSRFTVKDPA